MATIQLQSRDTLGAIAKANNTTIANLMQLNPQIKDPNLVYAGQSITLPTLQPIATSMPGQINLGIVGSTTTPEIPITSVAGTGFVAAPVTLPTATTPAITELSANDALLNQKNKLQTEVTDLETKIGNRLNTQNDAYTAGGIYDDIKALSDLKTQQQNLEEQGRQYLVGKGGTASGLASLTNLESRQALLQENQITNRVNTNLAIIDQKLKADNSAIDVLYKQKSDLLKTVSTNYSDLLTEEEKTKLEDRKYQQQIDLENLKFGNSILLERGKSAIEAAAKNGVVLSDADLAGIVNGDPTITNRVYGQNAPGIVNSEAENKVDLITSILDNTSGLSSSVGINAFGRSRLGVALAGGVAGSAVGATLGSILPGAGTLIGGLVTGIGGAIGAGMAVSGNINKFSNDLRAFADKSTLDYFAKVKSEGVTFGALTEKELNILESAANGQLGILKKDDGNGNITYESNLSEKDFKEAMTNIRSATQKIIIAKQYASEGKDTKALKNISNETLNTLYNTLKTQNSENADAYELNVNGVGSSATSTKTSLNIPQRNNNPGNVKSTGSNTGGIAAQFAVKDSSGKPKTDQYGHLIFASAEDGVKGLVADLTAKINGQSSVVPANPTLAQLGKVYAEDGNWTNGVSRILNLPSTTLVSSIPMSTLVLAIAKQEGFYS